MGMVSSGALPLPFFALSDTALGWVNLLGWLIATLGVTAAAIAGGYAWQPAVSARTEQHGPPRR